MRTLLPRLRKIGFRYWDPLGLRDCFEGDEPIKDEYDSYLLKAFAVAKRADDIAGIVNVLYESEIIMGIHTTTAAKRATAIEVLKIASETERPTKTAEIALRERAN